MTIRTARPDEGERLREIAIAFYERLGGRYLRDSKPMQFGRMIPVIGIDLD